jgi:transcriptional regulator with XRE-family HTH domain
LLQQVLVEAGIVDYMFGKRLADERRRLGLNQQEVADWFGMTRSAVTMMELDHSSLDAERLLILGKNGFDVLKVLTGEQGVVAAGRIVDWELALDITGRVDKWAASRGVTLSAEKRALLTKHLYLQFAARGQVEGAELDETMRMSA